MGKGIVGRWLSVLAALLLRAAPGWANWLAGGVEGYVTDADLDNVGVANVPVSLSTKNGYGYWSATTDGNGHYSFAASYAGEYEAHIQPGAKCGGGYAGFRKDCTVTGGEVETRSGQTRTASLLPPCASAAR